MPQRPEFFTGGGGAFSTPQDYMRFLQALLNGGSLGAVHILRPQTVAMMMVNQIGELNVHEMRTAHPGFSNSFDQFSRPAPQVGPVFRHQRAAGSEWAQRRKHLLGGPAQLLLLA